MQDQFKQAEDEYSRLKAELAAGRMTQEQFDAAAKRLTVQDSQGQYWAMGDEGYWVKRDGPPPPRPVANSSPPAPAPTRRTAPTGRPSRFPIVIVLAVAAACVVLLCTLGIGGVVLSNLNSPRVVVVPFSTETPVAAPSLAPTDAPPVALTDAPSPVAALATAAPSSIPIAPTSGPIGPTQSPMSGDMPTQATAVAPGLYVTGLSLNPPAPARRQDVQFTTTFLNTTNGERKIRLIVFIFTPDNMKNSLGQTTTNDVTIPLGSTQQASQGWKLSGGGSGCMNLLAEVGFIDGKIVRYFTGPDGSVFQQPFTVC